MATRSRIRWQVGWGIVFISLNVLLFTSSCSFKIIWPGKKRCAQINARQLGKVTLGMSRNQVLETMGTDDCELSSVNLGFEDTSLGNPYQIEIIHSTRGDRFEVLTYLTQALVSSASADVGEMTPLILKNDALVGIGYFDYQQIVSESNIRDRKLYESLDEIPGDQ